MRRSGAGRAPRHLRAALGFLRLPPRTPELRLLHRWLDSWTGVGLITVGVERLGMRLSLSHIAEGEWRAQFMGESQLVAPKGFGVAPTPWRAVQSADGGVGGGGPAEPASGQQGRVEEDAEWTPKSGASSRG